MSKPMLKLSTVCRYYEPDRKLSPFAHWASKTIRGMYGDQTSLPPDKKPVHTSSHTTSLLNVFISRRCLRTESNTVVSSKKGCQCVVIIVGGRQPTATASSCPTVHIHDRLSNFLSNNDRPQQMILAQVLFIRRHVHFLKMTSNREYCQWSAGLQR